MPDPAHKETDKILLQMEKELDSVYKTAYNEARKTANDFTSQFRAMDNEKRKKVETQELDEEEYNRWRRTQVFQSKRYHQMADTLAADMTKTNKIAASVINEHLPEVYAINHNYGTYEIEHAGKVNTQYTLYDRQTVERLMRDNPDLLPRTAAINVPKDLIWNKKNINSAVTQGILQGEDIDHISNRLAATVTDMSHTSAIRSARTMTTSAENGGRVDSYKRAESMGINMLQIWIATLDGRTRHEHRQLDGQKRPVGEPFEVEGYKIEFPADPKAEPFLVYNCRCTLGAQVKGVNLDMSDVTQRDSKLGDMSYEEWKEEKKKQDNAEPSTSESVKNNAVEPKINKKSLDNDSNHAIMKEEGVHAAGDKTAKPYNEDWSYDARVKDDVKVAVTEEQERMEKKFGKIETISGIELLTKVSSDEGEYSDNSYKIFLRHANKDNALSEMARIAKDKYKRGVWSTNDPRHVIRHEIGHAIQLSHRMNDENWPDKYSRIKSIYKKAKNKEDEYILPSKYAGENVGEFMSECIAASMKKYNSKTVTEVINIILEV
ncbi:phage minor head protein [Ruminococcus sp.]|uniref:phage minor head protein n=1 Tax=Ruminococcus sp. TaxID=41978 RepID=UPI0025D441A3|nr:phage minor head protein [Ruminococcus sp.]